MDSCEEDARDKGFSLGKYIKLAGNNEESDQMESRGKMRQDRQWHQIGENTLLRGQGRHTALQHHQEKAVGG